MGSKTWAAGCCMVGMFNVLAGGAEIALVPVGASGVHTIDGNEILLEGGGQRIFLEIQISGWDPALLKAWQATIDSSGYSSGLRGMLAVELAACSDDRDCRVAFGGICSLVGDSCVDDDDCQFPQFGERCRGSACSFLLPAGDFCKPGFIVSSRIDYVFRSTADIPAVDVSTPNFRYASLKTENSVSDPGILQYAGTLVLNVSLDAMGTFTVAFDENVDSTGLADDDGMFITPLTLTPALVTITCQTDVDCEDGNACTDDACEVDGTCSNENNFNDTVDCCNPADGTTMPIDDENECTVDTCNADGSVTHDRTPGAACGDPTDDACTDPDTCDEAGICQPNDALAGTPCGDPTDDDCTDPDTCDGTRTCLDNNEIAGTACGDPTDDDCTDPDTCDAVGTCRANNAPDGTLCDDGLFCTEGEICAAGDCGNGADTDCDDGITCTDDRCDEDNDTCVHALTAGFCSITGTCRASGEVNPDNDCEECNPALSTEDWSFRPPDSECDDGDPCTGTGRPGIGVDVCDGAGVCAGVPDLECNDNCAFAVEVVEGSNTGNNDNSGPDDAEASCQEDSNNDVWFVYTASCDGEVFLSTTGSGFTPSNDPVLSVYDACPDLGGTEIACDDDSGVDLQAALTFIASAGEKYWIRVAGFEENSGDIVLNISTVDDCLIDGICYPADALNPQNQCEACVPDVSTTSWSVRPEGSACGDPAEAECDNPDACDGAGVCESNHKPDGTGCSDEEIECTTEACSTCTFDLCEAGVCTHPPRPALPVIACGDGSDTECDNPDTCDGAGGCQKNFEDFGVACGDEDDDQCDHPDSCDGGGLCSDNLALDGTPCNDEDVCTGQDACQTGVCVGTPIPEAPIVESEGGRYVSVTPRPAGSVAPVALRLTSPDWPCLTKYIKLNGLLASDPVSLLPDDWGTVFANGPDIVPGSTYSVVAECGAFVSSPGSATTAIWGDTVGFFTGTGWTPPDGVVNILGDVVAILDKFQGLGGDLPIYWVDLVGVGPLGIECGPDHVIHIFDVVAGLDAFQGFSYEQTTRCPPPCP